LACVILEYFVNFLDDPYYEPLPWFLIVILGLVKLYLQIIIYVVTNTAEVIACYYPYLINYMDADSVSHMMHCKHLITDDDYEAITAAPNDCKMNTVLLQYVRGMDLSALFKFTDILKSIETHEKIGHNLELCKYLSYISMHLNVLNRKLIPF